MTRGPFPNVLGEGNAIETTSFPLTKRAAVLFEIEIAK